MQPGDMVRWESGGGYYRIREGKPRAGAVRLETPDGKNVGEVEGEDVALLPPELQVPEGYVLPTLFVQNIITTQRLAFADFCKDRRYVKVIRRPYGVLVARAELEGLYREFLSTWGPQQTYRKVVERARAARDPHLYKRKYCVACGKRKRLPANRAHPPACQKCRGKLNRARDHYCTYCGVKFTRADWKNLSPLYWPRQFVCPRGSILRRARADKGP